MGRTELPHFCCNLLLQTLKCGRKCNHARLACFLFKRNQHFVGSPRIVGLCFLVVVVEEAKCNCEGGGGGKFVEREEKEAK